MTTRRNFLKTTAAAAAAVAALPAVHAGGTDLLRIGLIGCGSRGTGAAEQALRADRNVKLVALGDAFPDRLNGSLDQLRRNRTVTAQVDVRPENCYVGFDAYRGVLQAGVDVVLLCTPPHFRPLHLRAAVEARKHIFAEKPIAVDAPGVRAALAACQEAQRHRLSVVSGLCYRYSRPKRETMQRVHDGAVGQIVALHTSYNTHGLWMRERQPHWSDMEWQMRNWLYFTWLSGDHNVEQHVHSLDKIAWAMNNQYPVKAVGMGGRQSRTGPEYGHIFDHHAVVYEYAGGVKCFSFCRQQDHCADEVSDFIYGTQGRVDVQRHVITGPQAWNFPVAQARADNMYQNEHNELFASIRSGNPINNGDWMCKSTLMGIMGRMATYTGQEITWQAALNSTENLTPPRYEWGALPTPPVARPGETEFS